MTQKPPEVCERRLWNRMDIWVVFSARSKSNGRRHLSLVLFYPSVQGRRRKLEQGQTVACKHDPRVKKAVVRDTNRHVRCQGWVKEDGGTAGVFRSCYVRDPNRHRYQHPCLWVYSLSICKVQAHLTLEGQKMVASSTLALILNVRHEILLLERSKGYKSDRGRTRSL